MSKHELSELMICCGILDDIGRMTKDDTTARQLKIVHERIETALEKLTGPLPEQKCVCLDWQKKKYCDKNCHT